MRLNLFSIFLLIFSYACENKKNETKKTEPHSHNKTVILSNTTDAVTANETTFDDDRSNDRTPDQAIEHTELDPDKHISPALLNKAVDYYYANVKRIKNKDVIVVIDFSKNSSKERFYIIDITT